MIFYRLLSIPNDCYRFRQLIIIDKFFFVTSISINFRYQSLLIGELNRLISMISINFRYRFLSINYGPEAFTEDIDPRQER